MMNPRVFRETPQGHQDPPGWRQGYDLALGAVGRVPTEPADSLNWTWGHIPVLELTIQLAERVSLSLCPDRSCMVLAALTAFPSKGGPLAQG